MLHAKVCAIAHHLRPASKHGDSSRESVVASGAASVSAFARASHPFQAACPLEALFSSLRTFSQVASALPGSPTIPVREMTLLQALMLAVRRPVHMLAREGAPGSRDSEQLRPCPTSQAYDMLGQHSTFSPQHAMRSHYCLHRGFSA